MSAFMVSDKTINRIVAGLERMSRNTPSPRDYPLYYAREAAGFDLEKYIKTPAALGQKIAEMNIRAIQARYPEKWEAMVIDTYQYKSLLSPSPMQLYKHIRCLLYQCSEGDVPNEIFFGVLNAITDQIAYWIVTESKEYEEAEWDAHE